MTPRDQAIAAFLQGAGWHEAVQTPLAGDASARRYLRLRQGALSAILMDSPAHGPDSPAQFLAIAQHLLALGLSPPRCFAQDAAQGLLLLEDLGDGVFAKIIAQNPACETVLYRRAVDVLAHVQRHAAPSDVPNLTADAWADAALLSTRRYAAAIQGAAPDDGDLRAALVAALHRHADGPRVLILRDYHAENLMDLPDRAGLAAVGLLDFQLAQLGQPAYDLVSLLQDARRDVTAPTQKAMMRHWCDLTGGAEADFSASFAIIGVQRALRILGVFAQLCTHMGKAGYLPLMPRVWGQLQANLAHPACADLALICARVIPMPNPDVLDKLEASCAIRPL